MHQSASVTKRSRRSASATRDWAVTDLHGWLQGNRNADGGWGYYPGNATRLEPTCWALVALARTSGTAEFGIVERWPRQGVWLADVPGAPINYAFQALAGLVLLSDSRTAAAAQALAAALLDVRGQRFDQASVIRQDNSLQAWPWIDATFSWVEPTALCLLLAKKLRGQLPEATSRERITVGERMLLDRACRTGGWNYGGSNVYGQELFPYVPTTAWALLAMHDRAADSVVSRSLRWLRKEARSEASAQALSLAVLALGVCGDSTEHVETTLVEQLPAAREVSSVLGIAMSLYALTRSPDGETTFAL